MLSPIPLSQFKKHRAYSLNDKLIILNLENSTLHVLGELSSWLFLSLDAGLSKAELKNELVENLIDTNLLDSAFKQIDGLLNPIINTSTYQQEYAELIDSISCPPSNIESLLSISILGKHFKIYTSCPDFISYLKTLYLNDATLDKQAADYHVLITPIGTTYQLTCNGVFVARIDKYAYIMPILMDHIQILAYQASDYLLTVHSAMLEKKGKGLMLPGQSGSGKSTLAVSLLAKGYRCYSDEVAVVSSQSSKLMPLPLPAAIKSGSWEVVQQDFPTIDSLVVWERADGRRSKYIDLPHTYHNLSETSVGCIIFPHYQADLASCELVSLDSISALQQLTLAGYQIKDNLTPQKVEQLLNWISTVSAYQLSYSNLDEAHKIVEQLMGTSNADN